jgi:pyruvate dehydrogenase E2 component (dihydrolipoamide acetyltransferase)
VPRVLRMPAVAANAVEAVLSDWPVPANTPFAAGDAIVTVETEKAVVDVPADADGVILAMLVQAGTAVEIGAPIALLGERGEVIEDLEAALAGLGLVSEHRPSTPAVAVDRPVAAPGPAEPVAAQAGRRVFSSPLARRLANDAGLTIPELVGTGPGGRIVRRDVERAIEARTASAGRPVGDRHVGVASVEAAPAAPAAPPMPAAGYEDIPHTRMRRAIADRLTESVRVAPHFFLSGTARVDALLELRKQLNDYGREAVSINDLIVLAAAHAHVLVPAMNVLWMSDAVRRFSGVDVAVAVRTDRGLVTPVLRGVDRMTVSTVATATRDLVSRARSGRLLDEELVGGTLTVTNLGALGTEAFAAIINPPQSAILAVGAAREEPVVHAGRLEVGRVIHVTLSVDHRPIDGAVAAEWMAAFLCLLEEPLRILA